jgi:putative phosphoribosyl transferase
MRAAVKGLRAHEPSHIVVAVPTAAPETCAAFEGDVDEVICAVTPRPFFGVGAWYHDFTQTSDEEVRSLLRETKAELEEQYGSR